MIARERWLSTQAAQISGLSFTEAGQEKSNILRSIRTALDYVDMDPGARQKIWQAILSMPPAQQAECDQILCLVRNFLVMKHQSLYALELVRNILDYSRSSDRHEEASTQSVFEAIARLVRPRLQKLGVRMDVAAGDHAVAMNQGHLMQVMLNLISNALDAIETLGPGERWIRIAVTVDQDRTVISCSNGGEPFSKERATAMLVDSPTTKTGKGYGLGLGISLRLMQKAHGMLEISSETPHPEIRLTLPSLKREEFRRSG